MGQFKGLPERMSYRITVAGLLYWVTFAGLVLAIVVPAWRHKRRLRTGTDSVVFVAASANGSTFGALLGDGRILVWNGEGDLKVTLRTRAHRGGQVAFSSDGAVVAVSRGWDDVEGPKGAGVELWDIGAKRRISTLPVSPASHLAFSPVRNELAVIEASDLSLYSTDGTALGRSLKTRTALAGVRFSPDGTMLAVAATSNGISVYDAELGERLWHLSTPDDVAPGYHDVVWTADGQSLIGLRHTMSGVTEFEDGPEIIDTWQLSTGRCQTKVLADKNTCSTLTPLPGGRVLGMSDWWTTRLLSANTLEQYVPDRLEGVVAAGARGPSIIVAKFDDVELCDAETLRPRRRLYEGPPVPTLWPAVLGLTAWILVLVARFRILQARRMEASAIPGPKPWSELR